MHDFITHEQVTGSPLAMACDRSQYLELLPRIFRSDGLANVGAQADTDPAPFIGRFLIGFEYLFEQLEQRQDGIESYFDPATCPKRFLPWLLGWFGLAPTTHAELADLDEPPQRQLVHEAYALCAQRGTAAGLIRLLEILTGCQPTIVTTEAPFHFQVILTSPNLDIEVIRAWIEAYKPAHVTYELEIKP